MSGPGTDPRTNGAIPVVAPGGGLYSAKLGNENSGSQAEQLSYSLLVDANNALFVYRYAVVLEDPSHGPAEQPRFEIRMFDQANNPIACGQYNVYSSSGLPGFVTIVNQFGETVNYQNWTAVGMDLTAYIGQVVTIEFATGDCSLGAHYGYAYIDCYCSPLQIASDFCPGAPATTLTAPLGFASYAWSTGEVTSSIVVQNPFIGQLFTCVLTSFTGCTVMLSTNLTPIALSGAFSFTGDCMNNVQFNDQTTVLSGPPVSGWWWDFGDGTTSTLQNPFHAFANPGPHTITMAAYSSINCPDSVIQTLTFLPSPVADFLTNPVCIGDSMYLQDLTPIVNGVDYQYWDFGDGSPQDPNADVAHLYSAVGVYDVMLFVADINGCSDSLVQQVQVGVLPALALGPDVEACDGNTVLLDAGDPNSTYLWSTAAQTQTISTTTSGVFWVEATAVGGCMLSDTVVVTFNPLPVALLADSTLCLDTPLVLDAGNPGSSYAWSTGAATQSIAVSTSGNYSVTITTPENCSISQTIAISLYPELFVDLGPDPYLCDGEVALLDAGAYVNTQFLWSTGSIGQTTTTDTTGVQWVAVSNPGCQAVDTILVVFQPLPQIALADTTLCVEQTVPLDAGNPGSTYSWTTGETTQTIVAEQQSGAYGVTVTLPTGCLDSSAAVVTFFPSIVIDLGPDTVVCEGEVLPLDATNPGAWYQWSTGSQLPTVEVTDDEFVYVYVTNGYCWAMDSIDMQFIAYPLHVERRLFDDCFEDPNHALELSAHQSGTLFEWSTGETTRSIVVREYGFYYVTATNPPGCSTTDTVLVREYCEPRIFVPNTFTPDGDGVNDIFMPVAYNMHIAELKIFDRWGQRIFSGEGGNIGWDGTTQGVTTPIGVFNWVISYQPMIDNEGTLGPADTIMGHVNLLR